MFSLKGDQSYSFWKTHCRRTATWNLVVSYNKIKVAITYQIWRHLCLLLDEFLTLLAQLLLSLFPLLKTQYNELARGLTPLSLGKCWSLAYNYKGDNKQAVNNWPTLLFLTSLTNYIELRETVPAYQVYTLGLWTLFKTSFFLKFHTLAAKIGQVKIGQSKNKTGNMKIITDPLPDCYVCIGFSFVETFVFVIVRL